MEKLKLMTILGTRPEIIRLSATIKCCDRYFRQILVHTGQNYDYELNQVFFEDLGLRAPDYYLNAAGANLGETIGTITDILQRPGNDVYVVQGAHEYLIPAVPEFILERNPDEGFVRVKLIEGMRSDEI